MANRTRIMRNRLTKRGMKEIFVVFWVYFLLAMNWVVEPEIVVKVAVNLPILEIIHKALWPYVYRPYIF
jgi:hypothetical protein